ncbi:MAG: type VI secretion system ATPase TssH [Desulfovibrio sp.]|nr:type VI secretion system ATPase TssH [Desulfovibrio sp.]
MTGVDMKALLDKCNAFCTTALTTAAGQAVTRTHYEVTIEHFFLACLSDSRSDIPLTLSHFGVEISNVTRLLNASLDDFRLGNAGRPVFSPLLIELFENAWLIASVDLGLSEIRSSAVLLAFLRKPAVYAQGSYSDVFSSVSRDDLMRDFPALAEQSDEVCRAPSTAEEGRTLPGAGQQGESFIAKYCEDITAKARNGKIDPVFGRDEEIRQMVDILARRRKNNPILVGEPGVGKTAVLEGLALRIVEGDVPEVLSGVTLLSLDLGLLEAGAGMKGEFERRLKGVLDEIKSSEASIILFIDEAHMLVGAGGAAGGSDAANLMKPALARGEIRTCAATTWKEYKKYFEKDPALARRFQPVALNEPSPETAALILRGIRANYEKAHGVLIRDDAVRAAANLAHRYITGRFLPDKAIDLLDTACARVKVSLSSSPAPVEDTTRSIQALDRELHGLERDKANGIEVDGDHMAELETTRESLRERLQDYERIWHEEKEAALDFLAKRTEMLEALEKNGDGKGTGEIKPEEDAAGGENPADDENGLQEKERLCREARTRFETLAEAHPFIHVEVTGQVVAQVVADWTGIPVGRMAEEQAVVVRDLDKLLSERIMGQESALQAIAKGIQAASAGLRSPDQPLGVFLLVGPSGVGKTETGLALADLLFGDERSHVTINMSEFQEKHTVSRLIGSPPGYVGYGEGGMLTEAVRRKPYTVVLLDEVEKAHIDVLNLFYQVFDKGILTDGEGKEVSFKNTIILLTSNLASDIIEEMTGENAEADMESVLSVVRPVLSEHFRPALLGRMTVVPYRSLDNAAMENICGLKLKSLARRLLENKGMTLHWSDDVVKQIVSRCLDTETGARAIDYILSLSVLPRLSKSILDHMSDGAMPSSVSLGLGEEGMFTMDFS